MKDIALFCYPENELVSVIVVTFNSSNFVTETLESIKSQTYKNIELIICDDNSGDDTIIICNKWMELNHHHFKHTKLLKSSINQGVAANCNKGIKTAAGSWIKLIAGDDTLRTECIKDFVSFVKANEEVRVVHSRVRVFRDNISEANYIFTAPKNMTRFYSSDVSAHEQYRILLRGNRISAPSIFISKEIYDIVGYYDEKMPYEDLPFSLRVTNSGFKFHFLDKCTVNYRVHSSSQYNHSDKLLFDEFFRKERLVYNHCIRRELSFSETIVDDIEFIRKKLFVLVGLNKMNGFNARIHSFFINLHIVLKRYFLKKEKIYE